MKGTHGLIVGFVSGAIGGNVIYFLMYRKFFVITRSSDENGELIPSTIGITYFLDIAIHIGIGVIGGMIGGFIGVKYLVY